MKTKNAIQFTTYALAEEVIKTLQNMAKNHLCTAEFGFGKGNLEILNFDATTTHVYATYEGKALINVLIHGNHISFYQYGFEEFYFDAKATKKLVELITNELLNLHTHLSNERGEKRLS